MFAGVLPRDPAVMGVYCDECLAFVDDRDDSFAVLEGERYVRLCEDCYWNRAYRDLEEVAE